MDQASRTRASRAGAVGPAGAGRSGLVLLLAALAPVLFFVVAQTVVIFGEARAEAERNAMARAQAISDLIDGEVLADLRALKAVAQSLNGVPLTRNRPAPGRIEYNAELFPQWTGALIWALDAPPQSPALFSSLPSEEIPVIPGEWRTLLGGQDRAVGGVERVGDALAPVIHMPVPRDRRNLALTLVLRPETFQTMLMAGLPADSVGAVVDREGLFIARSLDIEKRLGTPATTYVRDAIASAQSGIYRGRTYEGFENYTAFVTSNVTGWSVHIAISQSLIEGPRSRSLAVAIIGGLVCLAVLGGLAMLIAADLKRRRQAAEARYHAQKLETLGRLTGGIAHDFNNLLTVIVGNLEKLRRTLPAPDPASSAPAPESAAAISAALEASDRAAKLTRSMLAYSRQQALDLRVVPVNEIIDSFAHIAGRTLGEDVDITVDLDPDAGVIEIDDTQLGSAILNLAVNARDAMPDGGAIHISTRRVTIARDDRALKLKPGAYAKITVRDTGPGMDAATAARAFEPFFTTKPVGKGTGLGLSQVEGLVRQSGGAVDLETAPGAGASVHLYLPLTSRTPDAARDAVRDAAPEAGRKLSILLVEDEEGVRASAVDLLTHMGHEVQACPTADAGLIAMESGRHDLLFTDIVLPGDLNGIELAERARARQPDIGVILTTGYAGEALNMATDDFVLLPKPYGEAELGAKLREAIQQTVREAPAAARPQRILLVEDETLISIVATDILADAGYEVVDVPNARLALAALAEAEHPFDAAVVDLGLPDMNGTDLISAIRAAHPDLPVIVASGRGALLEAEGGVPEAACVVDKPYTANDLVGAVRRALEAV